MQRKISYVFLIVANQHEMEENYEKEATNLPSESGITSVSEFLATDEMKAAYDELKSSLNDQGLDFKLEGTDNTLTYIYAYRKRQLLLHLLMQKTAQ